MYGESLPSLASLAEASDLTRDSLAETRPVLQRVLLWAEPCLPPDTAERYAQIAAGKFVRGEFYYRSGTALEVYAGDILLVTVNGLGGTVKYRLNNAAPMRASLIPRRPWPAASGTYVNYYAAEEEVAREAMNGIWSLPKPESPAAHRERKLAEAGADPEGAK